MESTSTDNKPTLDNLPASISEKIRVATAEAEVAERLFVLAQREAAPYAKSDLVPVAYRNKPENCMIAREMAQRVGASVMAVMQNLYIIQGRPSWSARFAISAFNNCGRFTSIKYKFDGEGDDYGCIAWAKEKSTGEIVESPKVDWRMVKAEGWFDKAGSKWKTIPQLMFRYRAAAYLIATTAPELLNGLGTKEEAEDIPETPISAEIITDAAPKASARLASLVAETQAPEAEVADDNPEMELEAE